MTILRALRAEKARTRRLKPRMVRSCIPLRLLESVHGSLDLSSLVTPMPADGCRGLQTPWLSRWLHAYIARHFPGRRAHSLLYTPDSKPTGRRVDQEAGSTRHYAGRDA